MKNKVTISTLINHIVTTIDLMFKDIYPQYLLNYLYLITYGMILNYGDSNIGEIYEALNDIEFDLDNLGNKYTYHFDENMYFNDLTNNNYIQKIYNFKTNSHNISCKYRLMCRNIEDSKIKTLEYLTYALNSILFDKTKKVGLYDNIKVSFDVLVKGVRTDNPNNDFVINKIFNVLRTESIIKCLLNINKKKINNKKFADALLIIDDIQKDGYSVEGLNILVNLFRPLYEHEETRYIVDSLNGKSLIEDEFDCVLGKNSYKKVCDKLEILNKMINECKSGSKINYHELSVQFLTIRNTFVNRYLKLKYT